MEDNIIEPISTRFVRINQLVFGKSNSKIPKKYLVHRDGLLDALFALYEGCHVENLRKDKHVASFVDKFKEVMLELKLLRVNLKDFDLKKVIGQGHFGEVQLVVEKATGSVYAMKKLHKQETLSQQSMAFYEEERDIMAKTNSPWLTKLQYAFQDSQNLYLVMEFHPGGDMLSLLEKYDNVLPEEMAQFYLAELVLAIHSLHSMGYVHRDIKPDNILLDRTGHIKLADFGSASKLNKLKQITCAMPVGTPDYIAPEVLTTMNAGCLSNKSYGVECDWWSLGIVAYEMVFGTTPFASEKVLETYNNIMSFKNSLIFPTDSSEVSEPLTDLIKGLLQDSMNRLGYDQLIEHTLFTEIDWNNIRHVAPPYVPTVSSVDDTSNFIEFDPEPRQHFTDLDGNKKTFNGKNLPFIGFTYTSPFETLLERLSVNDYPSSPCHPNESDVSARRLELTSLQKKIADLTDLEDSLRVELEKLNTSVMVKDSDIETIKREKAVLEQLVFEQQDEIRNGKQLLDYERNHRLIVEKKAVQLLRCMKSRQKQNEIRLKAKSGEYCQTSEDGQNQTLLENAYMKIDEYLQEKVNLIEDLSHTKKILLDCQQKLREKEKEFMQSDTSRCSSDSSICNVEAVVPQSLVQKLELKNVQLEKELDAATISKRKAIIEIDTLKSVIADMEEQLQSGSSSSHELSDNSTEVDGQPIPSPGLSLKKYMKELVSKNKIIDELQQKLLLKEKSSTELHKNFQNIEEELQLCLDTNASTEEKVKYLEEYINIIRKKEDSHQPVENLEVSKSSVYVSCSDSSSEDSGKTVAVAEPKKHVWELVDVAASSDSENRSALSTEDSAYQLENLSLKNDLQSLKEDIEKLTVELKENEKHLKQKEEELSEAKLDLRISIRNEKQSEALVSSLRERNKDLREKVKALEESIGEREKAEESLQDQITASESEVSDLKRKLERKEKITEIEKARFEEQIKAMKDAFKSSKDVNEMFAKSQSHYDEISKQHMDLVKECEDKEKKTMTLQQENANLKNDLLRKQNECTKFNKINQVLKKACTELEEELKDFEILIEAREKSIKELTNDISGMRLDIKKLKDEATNSSSKAKLEGTRNERLKEQVSELSSVIENKDIVHDAELEQLRDELLHHKKIAADMKEQNSLLLKELSSKNNSSASYLKKILSLETQLCTIKEEAARHMTQISSLKSSNHKLTMSLEDAVVRQQDCELMISEIGTDLESEKARNSQEKIQLQETLSQQTKLIDFLQSKTENCEKKKKTLWLFGKKDNSSQPLPARDAEKLLETEKSRCRRLQDQLSQARAEKMALQRDLHNMNKSSTEIPVSPMSRAMHTAITHSPSSKYGCDSPVLVSKDVSRIVKPPGMKHNIPHRFLENLCMKSSKCCACLDSIHFGRQMFKCKECSINCHKACAVAIPSTCGLPKAFMQHFKSAIKEYSSLSNESSLCNPAGWVNVPRSNKQAWDKRYLKLDEEILYLQENPNSRVAIMTFDFGASENEIVVTSAVSATELPYTSTKDLPFVLKIECLPNTTCWPQRSLYIMTHGFEEKQMWVTLLENLAENQITDSSQKKQLGTRTIWTSKSEQQIDPMCTMVLDDKFLLLGAQEGLYVLKVGVDFNCSLENRVDGISSVFQIHHVKSIDMLVLIHNEDQRLSVTDMSFFKSNVLKCGHRMALKPVSEVKNCNLFAVEQTSSDAPYVCIAMYDTIKLCQWNPSSKQFSTKKIIDVKEPCSCILFTRNSAIFGTDVFYELSLQNYESKVFLDSNDPSLAGLVYGAQYHSFPVSILEISFNEADTEYLLCFHEMGVFVNSEGRRTRKDDMKWSRLPLSFAFHAPYLFITHFHSVKVIEIPPANASEAGAQASMKVKSSHYMGSGLVSQSILISSAENDHTELIMVDGASIGKSEFNIHPDSETTSTYTYSNGSVKGSATDGDAVDLDFSFTTLDDNISKLSDETSMSEM